MERSPTEVVHGLGPVRIRPDGAGEYTGARPVTGRTVVYELFDNHVSMLLDEAVYHAGHLRLGLRDTPATEIPAG